MSFKLLIICLLVMLIGVIEVFAFKDSVRTDEIIVTAARVPMLYSETGRVLTVIGKEEIKNAPVQSIQDLLSYAANVDVRKRGNFGIQSDISMRGGTYDQTLILLNGIKINDPQSGHHNMNLPIELDNVERIEILQGPASRVYGPYAFSGAINIITNSADKKNLHVALSVAEFNTYSANVSGSYSIAGISNYLSFTKKNSEGFTTNTDYNLANLFYQGAAKFAGGNLDVQAGYTDKAFGANSFYSSAFPNQFEEVKTTFAAVKYTTGTELILSPSFYWRKHQDKFELFRNNPASWYENHNYHLTSIYGGGLNAVYTSFLGSTSAGVEVRSEGILSNVLGKPLDTPVDVPGEKGMKFTNSADRLNTSFFFEHSFTYGVFSSSFGLMLNDNSDFGFKACPGIDINLKLADGLNTFVSINKAIRLPTFTDLYYSGPNSIGNPKLKPEEAISYEIGMKFAGVLFKSHISAFHRAGTNLIDWVKPVNPEDAKWESRNLTNVNANGAEINITFYPRNEFDNSPMKIVGLSYDYLNMDKSSGEFISQFVLDYLKHKMALAIEHDLPFGAGAAWKLSYENRIGMFQDFKTGENKDYKPFFNLDLRLYYSFKSYSIFLEGSNLMNSDYYDIGNVPLPGRTIRAGISMNWDL